MFRSYRVGTVYGIPFRLDITFLLILPVFTVVIGSQISDFVPVLNDAVGTTIDPEPLTGGAVPWLLGFAAAVGLFTCVALHEFGHSVVAMSLGYEIESITLWLLGGIAKPAEQPRNWRHELWIAVAGPAVNVVIVSVCLLLLFAVPFGDPIMFLVVYLSILNAGLVLFNMLPAFPLDGGRVLRALLARSRPYVRATRQAAAVGKVFSVLLALAGILLFDPILIAVALFVYIAATSESKQMMLDAAFEGVAIREVMTPAEQLSTVEKSVPLSDLLDRMLQERHTGYPVVSDGEFVGIVTLEDVQAAGTESEDVADVMTPADVVRTVAPSSEVMDAFQALSDNSVGRLPVVEDGTLRGIVTRTDLMRSFKIVMEQQRWDQEPTAASVRSDSGPGGDSVNVSRSVED